MDKLDVNKLGIYLAEKQCNFVLNAPSASHAGCVFERQIATIRNVLRAISLMYPGRLDDDSSVRTFLYEAMSIVNSRSLTAVNLNDPTLELLIPNHILTMKPFSAQPSPGIFDKQDMYLRKRWRRMQSSSRNSGTDGSRSVFKNSRIGKSGMPLSLTSRLATSSFSKMIQPVAASGHL